MLTLSEVLSDFRLYAGYPEDMGVMIDSRTKDGESPLHWMASLGDHVGIRLLVEAGANVNAVDKDGNTPMHEAVLRRHVSAVKALLESGADLGRKNDVGQTSLDIANSDRYQPMIAVLRDGRGA